jgi:hypothetical protein
MPERRARALAQDRKRPASVLRAWPSNLRAALPDRVRAAASGEPCSAEGYRVGTLRGKRTTNAVSESFEVALISPPCAFATSPQMKRPRPRLPSS